MRPANFVGFVNRMAAQLAAESAAHRKSIHRVEFEQICWLASTIECQAFILSEFARQMAQFKSADELDSFGSLNTSDT